MNKSELLSIAKPILFNTKMVRAILDNYKTATRRIVKFKGTKNPNWTGYVQDGLNLYNGNNEVCNEKPPYKVGDILYVRETWCWCPCWDCGMDTSEGCCDETAHKFYNIKRKEWGCYGYKASWELNSPPFDRWYPSIHMPKKAARIFLRVTDLRVERLHDISIKDISKEGIDNVEPNGTLDELCEHCPLPKEIQGVHCYGGEPVMCEGAHCDEALNIWENEYIEEFADLWDSTIKKTDLDRYGWNANPWVWVIEFERLDVDGQSPTGS